MHKTLVATIHFIKSPASFGSPPNSIISFSGDKYGNLHSSQFEIFEQILGGYRIVTSELPLDSRKSIFKVVPVQLSSKEGLPKRA